METYIWRLARFTSGNLLGCCVCELVCSALENFVPLRIPARQDRLKLYAAYMIIRFLMRY